MHASAELPHTCIRSLSFQFLDHILRYKIGSELKSMISSERRSPFAVMSHFKRCGEKEDGLAHQDNHIGS